MRIDHRNGSYQVLFEGLDSAVGTLPEDTRVITDSNVYAIYQDRLKRFPYVKVIEPGEQSKSIGALSEVLSWLASTRASRKTTICAFGGGVVGDLAGFVAAVYMRGVPLVQIPTSLLAQVDSSVGGKVGIDLPEGKNLAGAFYPPSRVSIAEDALSTLPPRQFANGMAEVWKYGFIMDSELVRLLSAHSFHSAQFGLGAIVKRCIDLKAQVVQADEFETLGIRAILNYGHTVGHAIEIVTGYGPVLHGEAISIGMVVEAKLGEMLGVTPVGTAEVVRESLTGQGLPTTHQSLSEVDSIVHAMYGDKKTVGGRIALSLLTGIGQCRLEEDVEESTIRNAILDS